MSSAVSANPMKPTGGSILGVVVVVTLVITVLAVIDILLERAEQSDLKGQAETAYASGMRLLKQGNASQSVELLRKAHSLELGNAGYELALTNALIAAGKTNEAEPPMSELLLREPNDGNVNLSAAHLMLQEGRSAEAEAHYHRAIYGEWPDDAAKHRLAARMELVQLLVREGRREELLAELLPLQEEGKKDPAVQKSLGSLFLIAGSAGRAADVYRASVERQPSAEAYRGLGEAELEMGQYRAAHAAFLAASLHAPHDERIRQRLELCNTLTQLDPTPRKMASLEKYRRGVAILQAVNADLKACRPDQPEEEPAAAGKTPAHVTNELSEELLGQAEKNWKERLAVCGEKTSAQEEPLRLIMEKLAQ